MKRTWKKAAGWLMALAVMGVWAMPASREIYALPGRLTLTRGEDRSMSLSFPLSVSVGDSAVAEPSVRASSGGTGLYGRSMTLSAQGEGSTTAEFRLFGLIPLRRMEIVVEEERMLIPGGQSIGVRLDARGVLVVSSGEVVDERGDRFHPAQEAGLRAGEIITAVEGVAVRDAAHLTQLINGAPQSRIRLLVESEGRERTVTVQPVTDRQDGTRRLGLWVRDSTAGIGTLSYVEPDTLAFAALGHAITDPDTGKILPIEEGCIYPSRILAVDQGTVASPGELKGAFDAEDEPLGTIDENQERGVFGQLITLPGGMGDPIPAASPDRVHLGEAVICSTVDDGGVREYDAQIIRLYPASRSDGKDIVIQITDPDLLSKTGGIVQGMSGSPIIQDGKLVGAVTHVLVNDPTRGYGIFIENMLDAAA